MAWPGFSTSCNVNDEWRLLLCILQVVSSGSSLSFFILQEPGANFLIPCLRKAKEVMGTPAFGEAIYEAVAKAARSETTLVIDPATGRLRPRRVVGELFHQLKTRHLSPAQSQYVFPKRRGRH